MNKSEAEQVKEFTEQSQRINCPCEPTPLSREQASFVIRMAVSELVELAQTVCESDEEAIDMVKEGLLTDLSDYDYEKPREMLEVAADQADAAADTIYYLYNCFARNGINLSSVFQVVHKANLAKRDPYTGEFIRREADGKILKPSGWKAPDIIAEMTRQKEYGSWV